jgi:hypothetical protein
MSSVRLCSGQKLATRTNRIAGNSARKKQYDSCAARPSTSSSRDSRQVRFASSDHESREAPTLDHVQALRRLGLI